MNYTIHPRYAVNPKYEAWFSDIDQRFQTSGQVLFRGRNVVKMYDAFDSDFEHVVVKCYPCRSLLKKVIYSFFDRTKAQKSFANAFKLESLGIYTPIEFAYGEVYDRGMLQRCYVMMDYCDWEPIASVVEAEDFDPVFLDDFTAFVVKLHQCGVLFHDMNSTNVLFKKRPDGHYSFGLIDINRMTFLTPGEPIRPQQRVENLMRFSSLSTFFKAFVGKYIEVLPLGEDWNVERFIAVKKKHDEAFARHKRRKCFYKSVFSRSK